MDRIERLTELRREVAPYPNSAACKVLHHLLTMMIEVLQEEQPTTVEPTPIAPIQGGPLAAEIDRIFPKTPPSSQLDPVDTKSGPVEQGSGCAHQWMVDTVQTQYPNHNLRLLDNPQGTLSWCRKCGALWHIDRIVVPVAQLHSSTSVKQPSKESVENFLEGYAGSQLSGSIEHKRWCAIFDKDSRGCTCGAIAPKLNPDVRY